MFFLILTKITFKHTSYKVSTMYKKNIDRVVEIFLYKAIHNNVISILNFKSFSIISLSL